MLRTRAGRVAIAVAALLLLALSACSGAGETRGLLGGPRTSAEAAPATTPRSIQFGPTGPTEPGFTRDTGREYTAARGYGWQSTSGTPLDMTWAARSRTSGAALTRSFVEAYRHGVGVSWRLNLPDGVYSITVGVGDASYTDSLDTVSANGVSIVSAFKPSAVRRYDSATVNVQVSTGTLVVSTFGGYHTKLNYLTVGSPVAPGPTSDPTVHLAWMYNTPRPTADLYPVARRFSTFILGATQTALISNVRAVNPRARLLQYFLFDQIIKPPPGSAEYHNNAAYQPGDFENIYENHPDWFLRKADGEPVVNKGIYYRMDPGNPGWRAFWLARVKAADIGWSGVYADNTDVSECGLDKEHAVIPKYPNDATYTDAIAGFLKYAYQHYFEASGKTFMVNLTDSCSGRDLSAKYRDYTTGIFREGWGVDWHTGYLGVRTWNAQLSEVEREVAVGGSAVLIAQGDRADTRREEFAFCSYLLVESPKVSFRYTQYLRRSYDFFWDYPNYRTDLGQATGPRFLAGDGTWRRNFTKGYVTVNPLTHAAAIHPNS